MKKYILSLLILISLFIITGCSNNNSSNNNNNENENQQVEKGRMYSLTRLSDKGINMFTSILPEDWTHKISSEDIVNSTHPFVETVVLTSPDKTAKITILSQHSYVENKKYNEGVNKDYYTTYLRQMDATTYLDYFMSRIYNGAVFERKEEVDSKILDQLKVLHDLRISLGKNDANQLQAQNYGIAISIGDEGYTSAKRLYTDGSSYYEASTSVSAISTNLKSSLSSLLDSRAVTWYMPYLIIYEADSKENFDKYYDDYNFIIANSNFTKDYYQMVEYVSSAIVNAYTAIYAERAKAALQATNDYIDSNYSSTSASTTNDKVMEMWDDVIKEVDNYKLDDGTTIKTSIHNDTVAQNGNEIYIGSKAGIPLGFNEVAKGY